RSRLGAGARPPRRRGARRRHVRGPAQRPLPHLSGTHELPGVRAGSAGGAAVTTFDAGPRYTPDELARLLRLPPPTGGRAAVVPAPLAPLLVVAGAGSGKTDTMAARVVWLVANGYGHPDRVLGLPFTRKAAGELAGRIRTRLGQLRRRLGADAFLEGE